MSFEYTPFKWHMRPLTKNCRPCPIEECDLVTDDTLINSNTHPPNYLTCSNSKRSSGHTITELSEWILLFTSIFVQFQFVTFNPVWLLYFTCIHYTVLFWNSRTVVHVLTKTWIVDFKWLWLCSKQRWWNGDQVTSIVSVSVHWATAQAEPLAIQPPSCHDA